MHDVLSANLFAHLLIALAMNRVSTTDLVGARGLH